MLLQENGSKVRLVSQTQETVSTPPEKWRKAQVSRNFSRKVSLKMMLVEINLGTITNLQIHRRMIVYQSHQLLEFPALQWWMPPQLQKPMILSMTRCPIQKNVNMNQLLILWYCPHLQALLLEANLFKRPLFYRERGSRDNKFYMEQQKLCLSKHETLKENVYIWRSDTSWICLC